MRSALKNDGHRTNPTVDFFILQFLLNFRTNNDSIECFYEKQDSAVLERIILIGLSQILNFT